MYYLYGIIYGCLFDLVIWKVRITVIDIIKQKIKKEWNENQIKWLAIIATIMLAVVCIPLLMLAHYNYPSTDDFCFGADLYHAIRNHKSSYEIFLAGLQEWGRYYRSWQGTYSATFLHIFQLGGKFAGGYFLTTYFLLGMLLIGSMLFYTRLFTQFLACKKNSAIFMASFLICVQLVFMPGMNESLYWFVGGAAYTFFYAVLLLFFAALFKMYQKEKVSVCLYAWMLFLLIVLGGGNYVTGLLALELLVLLVAGLIVCKKPYLKEVILLLVYIAAFLINILAPGNKVRQNAHTNMPIVESIIESLTVGMAFIKQWTHVYTWIVLLVLLPFIISGVLKTKYAYRFPVLFTIISFGLWCSNVTPSIFVNGTWGGERIVAIVYYQYYLLWVLNLAYWSGWILKRKEQALQNRLMVFFQTIPIRKMMIPYVFGMGSLLLINLLLTGYIHSTNPVIAIRSIRSGEAEQYRIEQQERWEYLEDTTEMDVEVPAFSVYPKLLFHDDIQVDATDWRNTGTANFFGKNSIKIAE